MRKTFPVILFCIFTLSMHLFAAESQDELKNYLSSMSRIVIEVEEAMRNLSMKILPAKNAMEQISGAIEKFELLNAPSLFLTDHNDMLSAFKSIRDGLKLFSENEREESVRLVREGAALLKHAAISIKTNAEKQGLIPVRSKTNRGTRPILPSQTPGIIAGTSPTLSPHIASPEIKSEFMTTGAGRPSAGISLKDIPDTTVPKDKDADLFKDVIKSAP